MRPSALIVATACTVALAPAALGDMVLDLGGGWQATIFEEDNVDLSVSFVSLEQDVLVIQKFGNFTRNDPFTGQPQPLHVAFNQIADDELTVSRIVLESDQLFNNSGQAWTSYRKILLGGNVAWNEDESAGFSIEPFTDRSYDDDHGIVTFTGGVLPDGGEWNPGVESGGLQIDVDLSGDDPVKFVMKDAPLPGPGALALVALAAVGPRRRRAP